MSAFHIDGIKAVWRRQLGSMLGNPLGYLFILAFVLISAAFLFVPDAFYSRNIADLGPLHGIMPWFLVVLLPALAMGAWSTERELGTEELLLTLPLSVADAVLGKFLAVATYYTLALLCSLSNVVVLKYLGNPDLGLVLANYLGWWLAGLVFAALSIIASVQVSLPAIAFVLGAIYCAIIAGGAMLLEWFDPCNRGVLGFGNLMIAIGATVAALVVAVLQLASRRWRPDSQMLVITQVLATVFGLALAVNIGRISQRQGIDIDLSSEGLSSVSAKSGEIVRAVEPVTVTAFISSNLPAELIIKAKEVEDKLKAIERSSGGKVEAKFYRPASAFDKVGSTAQQHFGVKPYKTMVDAASGRESEEFFLGAAVQCAGRSQVIGSFDPGLSVEYELTRAIRAVGSKKKPVLGIAMSDMQINGGMDMNTFQPRPSWAVVDELKKQYEVRDVNLDQPVDAEVGVLLAMQPSTLTPVQVEHLHDYIWEGRPALILEDPLPYFTQQPQLAPSQPRKAQQNFMGGGGQQPEAPKADLKPLFKALGLEFDNTQIAWSDYDPVTQLSQLKVARERMALVWCMRDRSCITNSDVTTGIDSLLMPSPGKIYAASDKGADLEVKPLITPAARNNWGTDTFNDYFMMMGPGQYRPAMEAPRHTRNKLGDPNRIPALAVEVTGTMPSAYPKTDPKAKVEDKKDEKKDALAKNDEAAKDDKKDEKKDEAKPEAKKGVPSPKKVHVIVVADTDFANDMFYYFYRNPDNSMSKDEAAVLRNLRNVQFLANAVDILANDQELMKLRSRRPQARPLALLEAEMQKCDKQHETARSAALQVYQDTVDKAQSDFQAKVDKVDSESDLDEITKVQKKEMLRQVEQRKLAITMEKIGRDRDDSIAMAKSERNVAIDKERQTVRLQAVGLPAIFMFALVLAVLLNRMRQERRFIPSSRKRTQP